MKIVRSVLIFGFILNFASAFLWFGSEDDDEQTKPAISTSTSQQPTALVQQQNRTINISNLFHELTENNSNQSQNQFPNLTNVQHQNQTLKKNNTANIPLSRFGAWMYQRAKHPSGNNHLSASRQNRVFNPSYRSFQRNKTIVGNSLNRQMTPSNSHLADSKANSSLNTNNKTQTIRSQNIVNKSNRQNRQRLLQNYYYHEQMRDYYGRLYQNSLGNNQANEQIALKQNKRELESENNNQADSLPMIFSRNALAKDETQH